MSSVIPFSQSEIARRTIRLPSPFEGEGAGLRDSETAGQLGARPSLATLPSGFEGLRALAEEENDEFSEEDFDDDFDDDFEEDLDDDLKEFEDSIEDAPDDGDDSDEDEDEVGEPFEEDDDF